MPSSRVALVSHFLNAPVNLDSRNRVHADTNRNNTVRGILGVDLLVDCLAESHVLLLPLFHACSRRDLRTGHVLLIVAKEARHHRRAAFVLCINHDCAAAIDMEPAHDFNQECRLAGAELTTELDKPAQREDVCLQQIACRQRRQRQADQRIVILCGSLEHFRKHWMLAVAGVDIN